MNDHAAQLLRTAVLGTFLYLANFGGLFLETRVLALVVLSVPIAVCPCTDGFDRAGNGFLDSMVVC